MSLRDELLMHCFLPLVVALLGYVIVFVRAKALQEVGKGE